VNRCATRKKWGKDRANDPSRFKWTEKRGPFGGEEALEGIGGDCDRHRAQPFRISCADITLKKEGLIEGSENVGSTHRASLRTGP